MANLAELFQRLEKFERTQKELQASKAEMAATIQALQKDIAEVRGIAAQLKQYFNTLSDQNQQLMSPSASQSEVSMSDILKLVREIKDV